MSGWWNIPNGANLATIAVGEAGLWALTLDNKVGVAAQLLDV